ncbi:MAG TPA: type II secretion system F family protein [Acidimicrobiales bacterium]|nr:type II secretion system F family protein [Acidimicrobiales bacterium]
MRRLASMAWLAAAALAAPVATPAGAAAQEGLALAVVSVDPSTPPDVRVVVAAPPQLAGEALPASAFRVEEPGGARPALRVEALAAEEIEIALVVDTSGSMSGGPLAAAKAAARTLLGQLPPGVPVAVVGFGATPTVATSRSTDRAAQLAAVDRLAAGGETALYDALATGLGQLSAGGGARRFVVLLSDGGDTASSTSLEAVAAALAGARVPVFAVELRTPESNSVVLARLASATGGQAVSASAPAALAGLFDGIAKQLVRQYALSWRSTASGGVAVDVVVEAAGVRASARAELALPAAALPAPGEATGPGAGPAGAASGSAWGSWALAVGGVLVGLALLALLLPAFLLHAPRSRALRAGGPSLGARGGLALLDPARALGRAGDRANTAAERLLGLVGAGPAMNARLERAGLDLRPAELVVMAALAAAVAGLAAGVLVGVLVGVLSAAAVVGAARVALEVLARRRQERFAGQLGDTLQLLAGALRTGYGLSQAIDVVARESEAPTSDEFRRLTVEVRLGRDLTEALRAMAERVRSVDFEWVVEAFEIHREVGGDLAEVLENVTATIRDRNRIRRHVRALSAEGRMSAAVLFVLPIGLAIATALSNPTYLRELTGTGAGHAMLAGAAGSMALGGAWLRRIVKPDF